MICCSIADSFRLRRFLFLGRLDIDDLNTEKERGVSRDFAFGLFAIGEVRRTNQVSLGTLSQVNEALVPTLDDLAFAYSELQRLSTVITGIEFCTVDKSAMIVSMNFVALLQFVPFSFLSLGNLEFALVNLLFS